MYQICLSGIPRIGKQRDMKSRFELHTRPDDNDVLLQSHDVNDR